MCENGWIANEQTEEQAALYPPREKTDFQCMLPAHTESHMRFVHLSTVSPVILHKPKIFQHSPHMSH